MARNYPRFLYSESPLTKKPGNFIVSTIFPKAIIKVNKTVIMGRERISLEIVECETNDEAERELLIKCATTWLKYTENIILS